ncbi:histidine kinase dimerization/phosphoacceptor domain-containing protein [Catenulispora yoronensis]
MRSSGKAGLSRRMPSPADACLAAGLAAMSLLVVLIARPDAPYRAPDVGSALLAAGAALSLLWRKIAPVTVVTVSAACIVASAAAGYAVTAVQWPAWIGLFTCFSLRIGWARIAAAAVALAAVAGYASLDRGTGGLMELSGVLMCFLIAVVAGDGARNRRAYAEAAEARMRAEAQMRAVLAERASAQERSRLARELHDSLGHAVNVMVMQAGVGRRVFDENPAFAHEALGHVEGLGRSALEELDRLLRIMQPDGGAGGAI